MTFLGSLIGQISATPIFLQDRLLGSKFDMPDFYETQSRPEHEDSSFYKRKASARSKLKGIFHWLRLVRAQLSKHGLEKNLGQRSSEFVKQRNKVVVSLLRDSDKIRKTRSSETNLLLKACICC